MEWFKIIIYVVTIFAIIFFGIPALCFSDKRLKWLESKLGIFRWK